MAGRSGFESIGYGCVLIECSFSAAKVHLVVDEDKETKGAKFFLHPSGSMMRQSSIVASEDVNLRPASAAIVRTS